MTPPRHKRSRELVDHLRRNLRQRREKLPGAFTLSSSTVSKTCPREEALARKFGVVRRDDIGPDLQFIFDIGQGIHDAAQNYMLGPTGAIRGVWRCLQCLTLAGSYPGDRQPMPSVCEKCGAFQPAERGFNFAYVEDELVDGPTGFVCHPDGYDATGLLWEFKSISTLSFTGSPKADHVVQVQTNMLLQRRVRNNDVPLTRLAYVDKSATTIDTAITEFHIDYDETLAMHYFRRAQELATYRINGKIPRRICGNAEDTRAKGCPLRTQCFMEDP